MDSQDRKEKKWSCVIKKNSAETEKIKSSHGKHEVGWTSSLVRIRHRPSEKTVENKRLFEASRRSQVRISYSCVECG